MTRILAVCVVLSLVSACATEPEKPQKRASVKSKSPQQKQANAKLATPPPAAERPLKTPPKPLSPGEKIDLPSIIHPKDQSEMVLVSAGKYLARSNVGSRSGKSEEVGGFFETHPAFYIDRYEVTVRQYKRVNPSYDEKPYAGGECPECPAMAVDLENAKRYCLWVGKRLPTEEEWEAAARGPTNNLFPWGNQFIPNHANIAGKEDGFLMAAPVGSFPLGTSPYGALDMIGNVWEWVTSSASSPTRADGGKMDAGKKTGILKGGGWNSAGQTADITHRSSVDPALLSPTFGFRCSKPAGDSAIKSQ